METPQVIFEDDYILALNKPSGMDIEALQSWVKDNFKFEVSDSRELRNGLVHRLDKPTSGVILFAKTESIFFALQKQFAERVVQKVYVALVHGSLAKELGTINEPVGRLPWKRTKFGVYPEGRPAVTNYKVIRVIPTEAEGSLSLLELYPKTG